MEAAASGGLTLLSTIWIVVVLVVIVLAITMVYWRFRRPVVRARRVPWWARRDRRIQKAAAANVQAILGDAKYVRPDAPGNHQDDL